MRIHIVNNCGELDLRLRVHVVSLGLLDSYSIIHPYSLYYPDTAFQMGDDWRKWTDQLATQYNEKLREIVKEEEQYWSFSGVGLWNEYFSIPFVVTSDPGFSQIDIRSWPMDYMSRLDCFHPSAAAHRLFAISVWNNLRAYMCV